MVTIWLDLGCLGMAGLCSYCMSGEGGMIWARGHD